MSTRHKACLPQTEDEPSNRGRPKKQAFTIDDAVQLVSDSSNGGESMPCWNEFLIHPAQIFRRRNLFRRHNICTDKFSQVIDKELTLGMAINACELKGTITNQGLSYHVRRERKRKREEELWENALFPIPQREGLMVVTVPAGDDTAGGSRSEISPLTAPTDETTDPSGDTTSVGSTS